MILVPVLAPLALAAGIDPLQFAIVVLLNLTIGMITPPVGALLFVTSIVSGVTMGKMARELLPMLGALLVVLLLLTLVPACQHLAAARVRLHPLSSPLTFCPPSASKGSIPMKLSHLIYAVAAAACVATPLAHAQKTLKYAHFQPAKRRPAQARRRPGVQGARREGDQRIDQGRDLPRQASSARTSRSMEGLSSARSSWRVAARRRDRQRLQADQRASACRSCTRATRMRARVLRRRVRATPSPTTWRRRPASACWRSPTTAFATSRTACGRSRRRPT